MNRFIHILPNNGINKLNGISLAHLSDLHIWQPEYYKNSISLFSLFKNNKWKDLKQLQGYLNVKYNRGPNLYQASCLTTALQQISKNENNPHLIITGDITNISLIDEFSHTKNLINDHFLQKKIDQFIFKDLNKQLLEKEINEMKLSIKNQSLDEPWRFYTAIPGNHDTYTPSSVEHNYFGQYFGDCIGFTHLNHYKNNNELNFEENKEQMEGNYFFRHNSNLFKELQINLSLNELFPNIKLLTNSNFTTNILLLSLKSSIPTKPFVAGGEITEDQLQKASNLLQEMQNIFKEQIKQELNGKKEENIKFFKVIAMHHPPIRRSKKTWREYLDGLDDDSKKRLLEFFDKEGIHLVLHGHTHHHKRIELNNSVNTVIVDNGSSTLVDLQKQNKLARYHLYHIEGCELKDVEQFIWNNNHALFEKNNEL
ncbi:hypothetical protein ABK040_011554 [Willaertia magna]